MSQFPNEIPADVLRTVWVIKLSETTTKKHIIDAFAPIAPAKDALIASFKGNNVALLEFQTLEGKRLILAKASEGATFPLEDGSLVSIRDARTSIRLFLEAQHQEQRPGQQTEQPMQQTQQQPQQQQPQPQQQPQQQQPQPQPHVPLQQGETEVVHFENRAQSTSPQPGNPRFREEINRSVTPPQTDPNDPASLRDRIKERLDTKNIRQEIPQNAMTQHQLSLIQSGKAQQGAVSEIKKCQASNIDELPLFEDHQVAQLKDKISNTIFSSEKLQLVSDAATTHSFSCQQVRDILASFRISFEQKQLLTEFFFKHIRDQENIDLVLESFEFSMDREITKKMLAMMAETSEPR